MAGETSKAPVQRLRGPRSRAENLLILLLLGGASAFPAAAQTGILETVAAHEVLTGLFVTSDRCLACHNGLVTPNGQDVSIGADWQSSMMAHSARDPYWHAAVRREILDHPLAGEAIEDKCSTCHMPMARSVARSLGESGRVFDHLPIGEAETALATLAADGVSCTVCHQIQAAGLGDEHSFTGGFSIGPVTSGARPLFGPFHVTGGLTRVMSSATGFAPEKGPHIQSSELCATCHTLYTHSLGPEGEVTGELPEQVPYLEWRHSSYPRENRSCQSCHMPVVEEPTPVASVLGEPRESLSRHVFRGGNFFMPRVFNRFRSELGVVATPSQLEQMAARTLEHLASSSASVDLRLLSRNQDHLLLEVVLENRAGHKLPTAYPSRRVWLHVVVRDSDGVVLFESGAFGPDGVVSGNDNDLDPTRYERHHQRIVSSEQVQIYEAILADPDGEVTTGLLTAVRYAKDNRLLPRGFDKDSAEPDVAVRGLAVDDPDFAAGRDRVLYDVGLDEADGELEVDAELWYQPIAYRWAMNLADYDAPETQRFVRYYRALADQSGAVLARSRLSVPRRTAALPSLGSEGQLTP